MAITKATASSIAPAAKGDLVVGSSTNDAAVLSVGTNDHVLTADSSTATGLKWAAAASGGGSITLITPTSTANSGGSVSTSGGAVTASSVNSVSLNGVFSSTYNNYFFTVQEIIASTNVDVYFRMRASGTDTTAADHNRAGTKVTYSAGASSVVNDNAGTFFMLGQYDATNKLSSYVHLYHPNLATDTNYYSLNPSRDASIIQGGFLNNNTQYDGITVYPSSGTLSCTIRVYGLAN